LSLRSKILGSACALALAALASPAFADGMTNFDGVFSGDYDHFDTNHGGGSGSDYGVSGSGAFGFGASNWAGEVDGGYHHSSGDGFDSDNWNIDGSVMYRGMWGRAGGVVGYTSVNGSGLDINATNYGGFAEWYAGHAFTVGVKGGGFNADHGLNGDYVGVALTGYVMPDFALRGAYDYAHLSHFGNENDWSAQGEWLVSERTPISIYAGYTNSRISGFGGSDTSNIWMVGIKYYCDNGPSTLVDRQRSGAATWGTSFDTTIAKF